MRRLSLVFTLLTALPGASRAQEPAEVTPNQPDQPNQPEQPAEGNPPPAAPAATDCAASEPAPTQIHGYVETGYHINFNDTAYGRFLGSYETTTGNGFLLHAAHLALGHSFNERLSVSVELDAGSDATVDGAALGAGYGIDVQEAYARYADPSGISITAGKFVTYQGIEVIEGPLNPTITRGYLFGYAEPFTHTGLKIHYAPSDAFDIGLAVVNGWDLVRDNNAGKTFMLRLGYTSPVFSFGISGHWGPEQAGNNDDARMSIDLTGSVALGDALTLWFQGNYGSEAGAGTVDGEDATWYGFGLQPVLTLGQFKLGARFEWMADPDGARFFGLFGDATSGAGVDTSLFNVTLTPGVTVCQGFVVRAEVRLDLNGDDLLTDAGGLDVSGALAASYAW